MQCNKGGNEQANLFYSLFGIAQIKVSHMGCVSCATKTNGSPAGCKNNGHCATGSCNQKSVFDWLSNMSLPSGQKPFDCMEVSFKNGRKQFYKNKNELSIHVGDVVATQVTKGGHDVGVVSLTGELVRLQMKKKKIKEDDDNRVKVIYRLATEKDISIWQKAREKEEAIKVKARQYAIDLGLQMKISDIEFQGDGTKATFYYTAEERVDFRELIKLFSQDFKIRIEMRQVGFRQEASRLGGIGSCGRELCCATWLTDFRSVNTSAARYQQLALNPVKLAGQCGKLKCCLNYELDAYLNALKDFPSTDTKLLTKKGVAHCQKINIFKNQLWYAYEGEWKTWFKISTTQANQIIELNKANKKPDNIEDYSSLLEDETPVNGFENVVGQDSITRFDNPKRKRNRNNQRRKKGRYRSVKSKK